jgi:hypothetical protein
MKTLIINDVTCLDTAGLWDNPFKVSIDMELAEFINESKIDEFKNKIYTDALTEFIHHFPGCTTKNEMEKALLSDAHYVSTRKSFFSKDYYLLYDLHPREPLNMSPNAILCLIYSINEDCEHNEPREVTKWTKKYSKI